MTTEFANTIKQTYSTGYTQELGNLNNAARYKCNNILDGTNIIAAKNAYEKLYSIYTTNAETVKVTDNLCPIEHCSDVTNCPHNAVKNDVSSPNVLAYTKGEDNGPNNVYVKDLKFYLDDCGARIRNYDNANPNDASYKKVKSDAINFRDGPYNSLVRTRSDLDNKMNEILGNNKNSVLYEKQSELDASVYSTLLWTVMVTSLLYYVFTKI